MYVPWNTQAEVAIKGLIDRLHARGVCKKPWKDEIGGCLLRVSPAPSGNVRRDDMFIAPEV